MCRSLGLPVSGTKAVLTELENHCQVSITIVKLGIMDCLVIVILSPGLLSEMVVYEVSKFIFAII